MIGKERLVFDTATPDETDNTGAYLRSSDGTLLTHTTDGSKERLDVSSGAEHDTGTAYTLGDKGSLALAVDPSGDYAPLKVNADGELLVDVQVNSGADKAEDAAHVSGDIGSYVLSVREDVLATSTSASGDYQSFKTDSKGALWAHISDSVLPSGTSWKVTQNTVDTTAELIVATDLTARRKILIQNASAGGKTLYIGDTNGVTAADGLRISAGGAAELELAAGVAIYAIGSAVGVDVRIAEIA